jgi:hypothetical protein
MGCEQKYKAPLPLSSSVEGESDREKGMGFFKLVRVLILISLVGLPDSAFAQLRKIKVCTPGAGTGSMHIYAAKDRGYFAQEGLDVEVLVTRGQICTMALINGQMELTTNPNVFDAIVAGKFRSALNGVDLRETISW